jgi:hypothetical protein
MTDNPTVCPPPTKGTRHLNQGNAPGRLSPYSQAVEWQRRLNKAALQPDVKPHALAMLARAWKEQEEFKRRMRGLPDPKPVDVASIEAEKRRRHRRRCQTADWEPGPTEAPVESPPEHGN